jgi:hypothetical protein
MFASDVYCPTCFAMPGESCVSKYIVHGAGELTPVICATHDTRIVESERVQKNLSPKPLKSER